MIPNNTKGASWKHASTEFVCGTIQNNRLDVEKENSLFLSLVLNNVLSFTVSTALETSIVPYTNLSKTISSGLVITRNINVLHNAIK